MLGSAVTVHGDDSGTMTLGVSRLHTFLALAAVVMTAAPSHGQVVEGRLLEGGTRRPVVLALVALVDASITVVDEAITDETGSFRLEAPVPGDYYIVADGLGYEPAIDGILELGDGGYLPIEFFLRPGPIELAPIVVEATRTVWNLRSVGFYERRESGFGGNFITPEELEQRKPFNARDLLRSIPRIRTQIDPLAGVSVFMRGPRGDECVPRLYVDGMQMSTFSWGLSLETVVSIEDMEAVEVYTGPASTPLQWSGTQNGCGAIVVWTKSPGAGR